MKIKNTLSGKENQNSTTITKKNNFFQPIKRGKIENYFIFFV